MLYTLNRVKKFSMNIFVRELA